MSRALASALAVLAASGCGKPQLGGAMLVVSAQSPAGTCLKVQVSSVKDESLVETRTFEELPASAQRTLGIAGTAAWGNGFAILSELRERGCTGPVVASDSRTVTGALPVPTVEVALAALDGDGDGFVSSAAALPGSDCGDDDALRKPGASERCNGLDDDCDSEIDEGLPLQPFFVDADRDGHGQPDASVRACTSAPGLASDGFDCDDSDAGVGPQAQEVCNGVDDNCVGGIDELFGVDAGCDPGALCLGRTACGADGGLQCVAVETPRAWFTDADGDGVGVAPALPELTCRMPVTSAVASAGDCDEGDPFAAPGQAELCDQGRDNDCNPATTEAACDGGWKTLTATGSLYAAMASAGPGAAWFAGDSSGLLYARVGAAVAPLTPRCNGGSGIGDGAIRALWWNPVSGALYLAAEDVFRLDPDGGCPRVFQATSRIYSLVGLAQSDGGALLYASGNDRFFRFTDPPSAQNQTVTLRPGDVSNSLVALGVDDVVLVGSSPGDKPMISRWNATGFVGSGFDAGLAAGPVDQVALDGAGRPWAFNGKGVLRFDGAAWQTLPFLADAGVATVTGARAFGGSRLYFTDTRGRVFRAKVGASEAQLELLYADGAAVYLSKVVGTSPNDLWTGGPGGRVVHFDDP